VLPGRETRRRLPRRCPRWGRSSSRPRRGAGRRARRIVDLGPGWREGMPPRSYGDEEWLAPTACLIGQAQAAGAARSRPSRARRAVPRSARRRPRTAGRSTPGRQQATGPGPERIGLCHLGEAPQPTRTSGSWRAGPSRHDDVPATWGRRLVLPGTSYLERDGQRQPGGGSSGCAGRRLPPRRAGGAGALRRSLEPSRPPRGRRPRRRSDGGGLPEGAGVAGSQAPGPSSASSATAHSSPARWFAAASLPAAGPVATRPGAQFRRSEPERPCSPRDVHQLGITKLVTRPAPR
jgi:hypothetical protein